MRRDVWLLIVRRRIVYLWLGYSIPARQERKLQLNVFETLTVPEDINGVNYGGGCIEVSYK